MIARIFILSPAKADFCPFGHFDHLREREQFLAFLTFYKVAVLANQVPKKAKGGNVHSFSIADAPKEEWRCGAGRSNKQRQRFHASAKATTFPLPVTLRTGRGFWSDVRIVVLVVWYALLAHLVEMALWAVLFVVCGEFPGFGTAFYHSAINFTTLGYGDVVMTLSWRLLGPLEAANGVLMFGVSTAMIFGVIRRLVQARFTDF